MGCVTFPAMRPAQYIDLAAQYIEACRTAAVVCETFSALRPAQYIETCRTAAVVCETFPEMRPAEIFWQTAVRQSAR